MRLLPNETATEKSFASIKVAMKWVSTTAVMAFLMAAMALTGQASFMPESVAHITSGSQVIAGTHLLNSRFSGTTRRYVLHVPAGLDPARPAPLVIAFHGGGGHAEYMADGDRYGLFLCGKSPI